MLRQNIYVSTASNLGNDDIQSILEASRRNNSQHAISGLLLYNGRNFLQLLEGQQADLQKLIEKIGNDPRHSGVSFLEDIEVDQRSCPDWDMRHIQILDEVSKRREALDGELPQNLDSKLRRIILNFASLN